jgi:hypothetical protein
MFVSVIPICFAELSFEPPLPIKLIGVISQNLMRTSYDHCYPVEGALSQRLLGLLGQSFVVMASLN